MLPGGAHPTVKPGPRKMETTFSIFDTGIRNSVYRNLEEVVLRGSGYKDVSSVKGYEAYEYFVRNLHIYTKSRPERQ